MRCSPRATSAAVIGDLHEPNGAEMRPPVVMAQAIADGALYFAIVSWTIRLASVLEWVTAVGFGVFCLPAIWSLWRGNGVPTVMGFPAYGSGPFERVGVPSTVPLVFAFMIVCILQAVAGWLLWGGSRTGAVLALALIPFGAVFWWGFALPYAVVLQVGVAALILLGWSSLT